MIPASAPKPSPIPPDLNTLLPHRQTPWNVSPALFNRLKAQASDQSYKLCEVLSSDPETNFILKYFEDQKPIGYSIKRVVCIHNPNHTGLFEHALNNMEEECKSSFFTSKGKDEEPKADRARALARWEVQTTQFSPVEIKSSSSRGTDKCSKAKVLPLWHGSSSEVCQSICSSGFTFFGKHHHFDENANQGGNKSTDKGYFGSGIYFTNNAQYATMYSKGHLLLAWVSMREPYPVVNDKPHPHKGSDMIKLEGKEHYQNYNAHFIPVVSIRPQDPQCLEYYPCYKDQPPVLDEFVVFEKSQALPRFWIELVVDFSNVVLSELSISPKLPPMAFGAAEWKKYIGDVGIEPPLPVDIDQILDAPCPFWPGKKVKDTHLLTLIPKTVNGKSLTLNYLEELVKHPKQGQATQYSDYWDPIKREYGGQPLQSSYWALMTIDVIPGSRGRGYEYPVRRLNELRQQAKILYEVPQLLEATTSILIEYLRTGKRLYSDNSDNPRKTYTQCHEKVSGCPTWPLVVGGFAAGGLGVVDYFTARVNYGDDLQNDYIGLGVLRKFCLGEGSKQSIAEEKPVVTSPSSAPLMAAPAVTTPPLSLVALAPLSMYVATLTPAPALVKAAPSLPSSTSVSILPALPIRLPPPIPKSNLPAIAFGKEQWAKYLGDVGEEPPLPPDIHQILQSPCPFFPGKKVEETHLLTLIPKIVNGRLLTLNYIEELVKKPRQGETIKYRYYWEEIKKEYGEQSLQNSCWALMTKDVIPGSRYKYYEDHVQLLKEFSQKAKAPYEVPQLLQAVTSLFVEYLRTRKRLYSDSPWTYTRCQEKVSCDPEWRSAVGGFTVGGLGIVNDCDSGPRNENQGVSGLRKFL